MQEPAITPELVQKHNLTPDEYSKIKEIIGREPNYTELGIFSVMWSEHCSYKNTRPLLKTFPTKSPKILVGAGEENAGIIDIGDNLAIAFKIESHNHPSAVEPFQGAATGVGGIVRDIMAMGARPVAVMDQLRFGAADAPDTRRVLDGVVRGRLRPLPPRSDARGCGDSGEAGAVAIRPRAHDVPALLEVAAGSAVASARIPLAGRQPPQPRG